MDLDTRASASDALSALFAFLGVDAEFTPAGISERVNSARKLRSRGAYWAQYYVAKVLQEFGLTRVRQAIKATGIPAMARRFNTVEKPNPPLSPRQFEGLREYYEDDIRTLSTKLDRDLSAWLVPPGNG